MLGMLLVNFIGGFAVCPKLLRHSNDYCSYADTIMPQFLFAAGFAMRLSLGRRLESGGRMPWARAIRRILGLALIAVAWYSFDDRESILDRFRNQDTGAVLYQLCKRNWFQTLLHIAATSLWILPVITSPARIRIWFAVGSGLLHVFLSYWFNFVWVNSDPKGIDGGPLGFLTWAIPALCGTLTCDAVRAFGVAAVRRIVMAGVLIMLLGWMLSLPTTAYNVPGDQVEQQKAKQLAPDPVFPAISRLSSWDGTIVEPPFVPPPDSDHRKWNYWMMSQRSGNLSYPTFAAGLSLLIYAGFLWGCDRKGWRLGMFRTLGTNSLAAYILHDIASGYIAPYFPEETSSAAQALLGFGCLTLTVYLCCRFLEWRRWFIRV